MKVTTSPDRLGRKLIPIPGDVRTTARSVHLSFGVGVWLKSIETAHPHLCKPALANQRQRPGSDVCYVPHLLARQLHGLSICPRHLVTVAEANSGCTTPPSGQRHPPRDNGLSVAPLFFPGPPSARFIPWAYGLPILHRHPGCFSFARVLESSPLAAGIHCKGSRPPAWTAKGATVCHTDDRAPSRPAYIG